MSDYISLHIPLTESTKDFLNKDRFDIMKEGVRILNFARGGLVNESDMIEALDSNKVACFVTDFPNEAQLQHPNIITFPHLGASTPESEKNCAFMAIDQLRDYLENGNVRFSVNFPQSRLPRLDAWRITVANANVPNMVGQISTCLADAGLNIEDLLNKSVGDLAYTIVDVNGPVTEEIEAELRAIDGVLTLRNLGKPV